MSSKDSSPPTSSSSIMLTTPKLFLQTEHRVTPIPTPTPIQTHSDLSPPITTSTVSPTLEEWEDCPEITSTLNSDVSNKVINDDDNTPSITSNTKTGNNKTENPQRKVVHARPKHSNILGFCIFCKDIVPVRITARCADCKSADLMLVDDLGIWESMTILHSFPTQIIHTSFYASSCTSNSKMFFDAQCLIHSASSTSLTGIFILPFVYPTPLLASSTIESDSFCSSSSSSSSVMSVNQQHPLRCPQCDRKTGPWLRFRCGHFMCVSHCWPRYVWLKIETKDVYRLSMPNYYTNAGYGEHKKVDAIQCPFRCPKSSGFIVEPSVIKMLGEQTFRAWKDLGNVELSKIKGNQLSPLFARTGTNEFRLGDMKVQMGNHKTSLSVPVSSSSSSSPSIPSLKGDKSYVMNYPYVDSKTCPGCSAETNRGINLNCQIKCKECKLYWCWLCVAEWTKDCHETHLIGY